MSQYNTGTVAVTNGSATVTGTGTLFSANVTAGDFFTVVGDNAFYTVGAVDSDTQLTLAATYAGITASGKAYTLVKDFTTNFGFPVPNQGDIETALVVKRAIEEIDSELNTAGLGGDGREWIDLKDTPSFVNVTQFTIPTDKTANYHVNRRIRCSDASTLHGRITASSFAASETTVTVALDSGSLSASLSAVALGIASAATPAITGDGVVGGTPLLDAIGEYTAGAGVTIDSVRLKDQRVENLLDPVAPGDAATKSYVDGLVVSGVYWKQPVRVATTANITLSGEQTIDGVLTSADRVLVKNQTTAAENGIYVSAAGAWARAADADSDAEVTAGIAAWVNEGTAAGDSGWTLTTDDPITLGATALTFTQFSGGGGVSDVTGSAPVTSSGGATPDIAITAATTGAAGSMSASDKSKLDGIEASADVTDEANLRTALAALTADAAFNSKKITGLADPTAAQDAATKAYVDANGGGGGSVDWKDSVRVATTANITLSSQQTIDGIFVSTGTRVLVKNQTTGSENGIYLSSTSAWSRSSDADAGAEVTPGLAVTVEEGTANADTQWLLTTDGAITLGTTALTFAEFTGSGGGVSVVTGSAPITSSGGGTPDIAITAATTGAAGSMSSADKSKLDGVEASADVTDEANVRAALAALAGNPVLERSTATAIFLDLKSGVSSGNAAFIRFRANDSASNVTTYGQIESTILDATDGSEDARLDFLTEVGGTIANRVFIGAGLFTPGATGGDKGTNSINASAVYDDDTLLSCYVFDAALDGVIDFEKWDAKVPDRIIPATFEDREATGPDGLPIIERIELTPETTVFRAHQPARAFDTAMLDPDVFAAHWKSRRHLPALPEEAAFDPVADKLSIGDWAQRLLETVECQAVHIDKLNQRIKALEGV